SFLNKGLTLSLTDKREKKEDGSFKGNIFYSEGGLSEFVRFLDESKTSLLEKPINVEGKEDNVEVEVALQFNTSYSENISSFVNNINTREGGAHVNGFRMAVTREFKNYGRAEGMFTKAKVNVSSEDFREGLTAVVSVKVPEPQFKGQTKGELGNSEVTGIVSRTVGTALKIFLEENPQQRSEERRVGKESRCR